MSDDTTYEQGKYYYEGKHFEALARKEAALAAKAELELAERRRVNDVEAALNVRNYTLNFEQTVRSTKDTRDLLDMWHRIDGDAPWTIMMNSPGGSVFDGMALFDHIATHSLRGGGTHEVTIKVRGMAASMGGIILQAADKRVCGAESMILIHKVSTMAGGSVDDIEDELKLLNKMCDRVVSIFVERSGGKLTPAQVKKNWTKTDWWLDSDQAVSLGVVDAIG